MTNSSALKYLSSSLSRAFAGGGLVSNISVQRRFLELLRMFDDIVFDDDDICCYLASSSMVC